MKCYLRSIVLIAVLASGPAFPAADPGPGSASAPPDPVLEKAKPALERNDWAAAAAALRDGIARDASVAEYHNLYAFALRSGANPPMDLVFKHYNEALRIDPKHRGAHEYLGEAYLMVGNLAKAKEHLGILDGLCTFGCEEYTKLKNAIAAHEARRASK